MVINVRCGWGSVKVFSILGAIVGDIVIGDLIVEVVVGSYSLCGVVIVNVYSEQLN